MKKKLFQLFEKVLIYYQIKFESFICLPPVAKSEIKA